MRYEDYEIRDFLRRTEGIEFMINSTRNTVSKETIIRTIILVVALCNQIFAAAGKPLIPIEDETVSELINVGFTVITAIWAWWKNNSYSEEAIVADKIKNNLTNGTINKNDVNKLTEGL